MYMNEINFSINWNNKLDCKAFTTLRLSSRFNIGDKVEIRLKKAFKCFATIIDKKCFKLKNITEWVAYLDTGYDKEECKKILEKMYKNKNVDWITQDIYFYLIKKEK